MDGMENLMPREKMLQYGIETLTDVELLALFLRVGTRRQDVLSYAQALLQRFGSLYALLSADKAQLIAVDGLGLAKYAQLKGIAELARRYFSSQLVEEAALVTPSMTREFLQSQLTEEEREIFMVIFLVFAAGLWLHIDGLGGLFLAILGVIGFLTKKSKIG